MKIIAGWGLGTRSRNSRAAWLCFLFQVALLAFQIVSSLELSRSLKPHYHIVALETVVCRKKWAQEFCKR